MLMRSLAHLLPCTRTPEISASGFFFQAEDGIRDIGVTGVQTCALPILGLHLPLPDLRRRRGDSPRAARQSDRRTARHIARRDPLLLGLPARRQGRREPRRRQRRVREADPDRDLRTALRGALRHLARRHVRPRPRRQPARLRTLDPRTAADLRAGDQGAAEVLEDLCPRTDEAWRMSSVTSTAQAPMTQRPLWRRLIGFNLLSAVILGIGGYYLGWWIGHLVTEGKSFEYTTATDENDVALLLAYFGGVIGFLVGLGFANYPISRLLGRPASLREKEEHGIGRYFGLCTDHKVVGIQYLCGIGLFFFIGGLDAELDPGPAPPHNP